MLLELTRRWAVLASVIILSTVAWASVAHAQNPIRRVDPTTPETNPANQDGLDWDTAYATLQQALDDAALTIQSETDILVSEGDHFPTEESGGSGQEFRTFVVKSGVRILGGYLGWNGGAPGNSDPDDPDGVFQQTVLTGAFSSGNPSYHVMTIADPSTLGEAVLMRGFVVTGGLADGGSVDDTGGGLRITQSSGLVEMEYLWILSNTAEGQGGGIYLARGNGATTMRFCTLGRNYGDQGGAVYFGQGAGLTMANCSFALNGNLGAISGAPITSQGGALWVGGETTVNAQNLLIHDNAAEEGGGIFHAPITANVSVNLEHFYRNCTIAYNIVDTGDTSDGAGLHVAPGLLSMSLDQEICTRSQVFGPVRQGCADVATSVDGSAEAGLPRVRSAPRGRRSASCGDRGVAS